MSLKYVKRSAAAVLALGLTGLVLTTLPRADAATGSDIAAIAGANLGKHYCSTNSAGGTGFETSCQGHFWCADFAKWVWRQAGIDVAGLDTWAGHFVSQYGPLGPTPHVGDAVIFNYNGNGYADHVAVVTAVYGDGTVDSIGGDEGGTGSGEQFWTTAYVKKDHYRGGVGYSSAMGMTLSGYVSPHNLQPPTRPQADLYQRHGDGSLWHYTGTPMTGWQKLDANPGTVAVASAADGGQLYQLHTDGTLWQYTGVPMNGWARLDNNPHTTAIAAANGSVFQLHNDGQIYAHTGPVNAGWLQLDKNPNTTAIAATATDLYQLQNDGTLFVYTGTPITGWQKLDANHATIAITASDRRHDVYQLHTDGSIWGYTGIPMTGWARLDTNPATVQIAAAPDGTLYQRHTDGSIWAHTGPATTGWQKIDTNPTATTITIGDDATLYQLHTDGSIWRYTGTPMTGWQKLDANPTTTTITAGTTRNAHR
jgi:hypothetical protein